jgi:hypothetical protein
MPNWCENTLTVTGEATEVARFRQLATPHEEHAHTDLSLDSLYPMPKTEQENCMNGTLSTGVPSGRFASAWSPPVAWLTKVARDFPGLRFGLTYADPGVGFAGVAIAHQGTLIEDECAACA